MLFLGVFCDWRRSACFPVFRAGACSDFRPGKSAGLIRHVRDQEHFPNRFEVLAMFKRSKRNRSVVELRTERLLDGGNIERLEERKMLAGNVTAAINASGDLVVQGDGESNAIQIEIDSVGNVVIDGLSGTSIDDSGLVGSVVSGDVVINMRGGDDYVVLGGVAGADSSYRSSVPIEDVRISTGAGNDEALVGFVYQGLRFAGDVNINAGSGDDYAAVKYSDVDGSISISGSGGNDILGLGESLTNEVEIRGGAGDDEARIVESQTVEQMEINLGGGDNLANVELSAAAGLRISSAGGMDEVFVDGFDAKNSDVTILTGGKNDQITIDELRDGGDLRVQTAGGDDVVEISDATFEQARISSAAGNDDVTTRRSVFGESLFTMGGGNDRLSMFESSAFGEVRGNGGDDIFVNNSADPLPDVDNVGFEVFAVL